MTYFVDTLFGLIRKSNIKLALYYTNYQFYPVLNLVIIKLAHNIAVGKPPKTKWILQMRTIEPV